MQICSEAVQEQDSPLVSIQQNGTYFINYEVGLAITGVAGLFSTYRYAHEWIVLSSQINLYFAYNLPD
jgi:hypothetical protein